MMFQPELSTAMSFMKMIALDVSGDYEQRMFAKRGRAFMIALFQASSIVLVEVINIINLQTITNMNDLVFDYVALACIADFDEFFVYAYMDSR